MENNKKIEPQNPLQQEVREKKGKLSSLNLADIIEESSESQGDTLPGTLEIN